MHVAYGEECFADRTVWYWHKSFRNGWIEIDELPPSGRLRSPFTKVNINTIAAATEVDCHYSVRKLEDLLHIPKMTIHQILKDELQIQRICSSWVPHFLTGKQLQQRIDCCAENFGIIAEDPDFLMRVITFDESWIHYHDPRPKSEWEHWKCKNDWKLREVHQQKLAGKVQLIAFFDYRDMVYQHLCPPQTRINK